MSTLHQRIKQGYISQTSIRAAVTLCEMAYDRKTKPDRYIPIEDDNSVLHQQAEREYSAKPKENIPDMKIEDYALDFQTWKNPVLQYSYT